MGGPRPDAVRTAEILAAIPAFSKVYEAAKATLESPEFAWYPYDSLGSLKIALTLLATASEDVFASVRNRRMIDIGSGDGANAFLLNSLQFDVTAVDYESFNHNQMKGLRALQNYFNPRIDVRSINLDRHSLDEDEEFGIAIFLGLLYHLKNPVNFLESLARRCEYCLLSTRVIRESSWKRTKQFAPNACLVQSDELNADDTNYWLFTPTGLDHLLRRTGWSIVKSSVVKGNGDASDARMYCLARSLKKPQWTGLYGLHPSEDHGWRWTSGKFALNVWSTPATRGAVELKVSVPEAVLDGRISIQLSIEGHVTEHEIKNAGSQVIVSDPCLASAGTVTVNAALSKCLPPSAQDSRELGIILVDARWVVR